MENAEIARVFDEIADCLEIQADNPFRIRAYRNAARIIRDMPRPAAELAAEDALLQPGIGKDLAAKIRTLLDTGELPEHQRLCGLVPPGLREMMTIPGVGPKKAVALRKRLGVRSVPELRRAALNGRIRRLKGFGEKSEAAILANLEKLESSTRRFLLAEAEPFARLLVEHLKKSPGVGRIEAAGSFRRRKDTVGDLDILVTAAEPGRVMDRFGAFPGAALLGRGPTKMSSRLPNGLQVDLRVVPEQSYGAALQYFTGSKPHSVLLRKRAIERGLKLNEYGVFRGRARVAGRTEQEVYAAVGLPWIPPELREARGELELAERGALPRLVELSDIKGDLHMHTNVTDGRASLEQMLAAARRRGYEYVAITDHSKKLAMAGGLDERRLREHWENIEKAAEKAGGLTVLKGVEVDILEDGTLDLSDDVLKEADWVVAGLHYGQRQPRAQITQRLINAIKDKYVSVIAHPTGRRLGRRPAYDVDMDEVAKAAADYGCAFEVDGQPERMDLDDVNLAAAKDKGIAVVVDSDAHSTEELGFMRYGVWQARRAGLTAEQVLNTRSLEDLLDFRR